MKLRPLVILLCLIVFVGFLAYRIDISFPVRPPSLNNTFTPSTQPAQQEIGSYDVLGKVVSAAQAENLLQTEEGKTLLSPANGAVEITEDLIKLGRKAFYNETFGNEYFFTDVVGAIDGPINLVSMGKAIAALGGKPTTNLQISLEQDVAIGGRKFAAGTVLNTGLDVPHGSLIPLGMQARINGGKLRIGLTCAACHASVDRETGRILEGAPNVDIDTGLLQAFATNSAAMFRQTGINPTSTTIPRGEHTYINAYGQESRLPDAIALEDAVDAQLLAWSPGNFDSSPDNKNNPSQIPSSYTFDTWPYGWSGFSSVGWFHGLTTLNNNVHATNSDPTSGADSSQALLRIDKETYLGVILQNSANSKFRLPEKAKPSEFLDKIDPTPGEPAINEVIRMPGYPKGSIFILDGLMASSPGLPVAAQLNGMSAYQNSLAPPPVKTQSTASLQRGAAVFTKASCIECHSGRYFTNHDVIPEEEVKSQPSRASALAALPKIFIPPQTYPGSVSVPLPPDPPVLSVPTDITPQRVTDLAYAINNPSGGYKVQNLIGLYLSAPYLHDGGVAASSEALKLDADGHYTIAHPDQLGLAGTWMRNIEPDPEASLRVLLDRNLRQLAIAANQDDPQLQATNVDGSGHNYWVDEEAGFTTGDQSDLIEFLLSIDDDPEVLPDSVSAKVAAGGK
jgi:hypothetical protein